MDASRWQRFGPVAGVLAVVLTVISLVITGEDSPEFMDDPDKITAYYADDPGKLIGGYFLDGLGTVLLIVFAAALYVRLGGVRRGLLPPAAFGGAIGMCAMFMLFDVANLAASFRAEEDDQIAADAATALNDLSWAALGAGATLFAAVFVGCAALSALGSGVLPRWLGYVSLVLAVGLLIGPIAFMFLPVLLLWIVVVSVLMWMEPRTADTVPPPAATTPA